MRPNAKKSKIAATRMEYNKRVVHRGPRERHSLEVGMVFRKENKTVVKMPATTSDQDKYAT
jgi:hypothetical protein